VPSISPTPPDVYIEAMSRADRCPECVYNLQPPYRVEIEADGYTAYYHCEPCDHMWFTAWGRS